MLVCVFKSISPEELQASDGHRIICTRVYNIAKEMVLLPSVRLPKRLLSRILTKEFSDGRS